jgi:transposase
MPKFLSDSQVKELRTAHRVVANKRIADWIKSILMVNNGYEYDEIRSVLLLDESTVRRAIKRFQEDGVDGLLEKRYSGGISSLTTVQEAQLKRFLSKNTQRTTTAIKEHILTVYRVSFTLSGVTKLLHRLGFSYKKPKLIPGKINLKKQQQFIKKYHHIKSTLKSQDHIYFGDATHPEHNTQANYGWILKGKTNDKYLKSNTGRQRLNLNGVVDVAHQKAIVLSEDTINAQSVIHLFNTISEQQPEGKIYVVLDNARYHHARLVKQWLKLHRRFKILFLPTYSPNLNVIERLWRFFHNQIAWEHYFETFEEFKKASLDFFKNLNKYQEKLSTLLTDNFQTFTPAQLQT